MALWILFEPLLARKKLYLSS